MTRLTGRLGEVEVCALEPGAVRPEGGADVEAALVVLTGTVSGLGEGDARHLPPGAPADLVAGAEGARLLIVRVPATGGPRPRGAGDTGEAGPRPGRAGDTGEASAQVLAAGGGFADMRVRWLVSGAATGSTGLVVATSTFAPDGHHELHRHPHAEEFFLVVEGSGEHLTGSGPVRLGPGDIVLVAAGERHGYRTDAGVTTRTVYGYLGAAGLDSAGYEVCP